MDIKYPGITVQLTGENGNSFFIIGRVTRALRRNDVPTEEIKQFTDEAMSGDYDNILQTCMKWVNVE